MDKSPEAFRTISEVAETLDTPAHVLRFWETRFPQVRPVKRAGGRRYYRPSDVALLSGIKRLLHDEGMTIRGVQKILREQGIRHVAALGSGQPVTADDNAAIEAELSAALGSGAQDPLPAAEAETAQVIALETVLARAERSAPPVQPDLWDAALPDTEPTGTAPAAAAEPAIEGQPDQTEPPADTAAPDAEEGVAEAPMVEMAEPETASATVTTVDAGTRGAEDIDTLRNQAPVAPPATADAEMPPAPTAESGGIESEPPVETPTAAARLRTLPAGGLSHHADAVADLQDRILTLRSKLAEAANRRVRGS